MFCISTVARCIFFGNLKEVDNVFCVSKYHSWKFREKILSFIRPNEISFFAIHDTKGLKLLTHVWLNFSHLNEHKFRHDFRDTVDPMCKWGLEIETIRLFLLCCRMYSAIRTELLDNTSNVDSHLTNYSDDNLLNILLYGLEYFSVKINRSILKSTMTFLKSSECLMTHCFYKTKNTITIVVVASICLFFYLLYVQDLLKAEDTFW